MKRLTAIFGLLLFAALAGCSSSDEKPYVERSVHELYNAAVNALTDKNWVIAANLFDEVERQHPYSVWATKAQLMAGYAQYEAGNYPDAVIALNRYIQLHPGNKDVAYAYYLKALCFYEQISDVKRDQGFTRRALAGLRDVIKRFPATKYARDAKLKLDLTLDHLAGKEMSVGRYYLRQGQHLAAINRFKRVVDEYQTTTHVPEALHRLAESYRSIGLEEEARKVAAVLGHNYPGDEWYLDSYALVTGKDVRKKKEEKGFLARTWDWIF